MTIKPLGTPRLLVGDAATITRLRSLLSGGATSATKFKQAVDRQVAGGDLYDFQPWNVALMGQVTGTPSYCNYAVAQTDAFVSSEEALIKGGRAPTVAGDSYLDVGGIVGNLSIVYDWCRPQMTSAQRTRWMNYGNQAVSNVWNYKTATWGGKSFPWTGWAVDDPSDNYYYSFLRATMTLGLATYGENSQAQTWINQFRTVKIANQLVPTFTSDLAGGGSREGTGYGVAMKGLFDLYYWWEKSTGERIADLTPHTLSSLDKMVHDIVPTLDRISPTGDQSRDSTASLFDYHREYLEILSRLYPTDRMSGVSKTLLAASSVPTMSQYFEYWIDYVYDQADITAQPLSLVQTAHWGSGTGQFSVRSAWANTATYANFICGPYTQSHAHQDQGSFVLYKGVWQAVDEDIYSHSGLASSVPPHNLVRVEQNGNVVQQGWETSCKMKALANGASYAYALADLGGTYAESGVVPQMQREFVMVKPGVVVLFDRVTTTGTGMRRIWSLNLPSAPSVSGDSLSLTQGAHVLKVQRLAPTGLTWSVQSWPSLDSDMGSGARVDVAHSSTNSSQFLNVLGTDGAFTKAVRSDATGQVGTLITLPDGGTALIRFNTATTGGTIELRNSSGAVTSTGALPTTIQAPGRFTS
jgi:hypothetical protein